MKFFMVFASLLVLAACLATQSNAAAAAPKDDARFVDGLDALKQLEPELHSRHKRATCDLLSGAGVNHSACAAHCLLRGNRGGYCNAQAVCVCRK